MFFIFSVGLLNYELVYFFNLIWSDLILGNPSNDLSEANALIYPNKERITTPDLESYII